MFFLGKRDWARSHNQVVIVHCLVKPFLHFASSKKIRVVALLESQRFDNKIYLN